MIGPKKTTNEQMSNETKPTRGHESSAQSPGDKSKRVGVRVRVNGEICWMMLGWYFREGGIEI